MMNPTDPRNLLPPPPPLYTATTSSSPGRQEFVNPGIQSIPPMSNYSPPQGYGHIPINPMPGPPYHKIAQPMQPRESIQSQQSVFQQYTPQQSYPQTHYNQAYPDQYYPQSAGYQQTTYRSPVHSVPQQYLPQHMSYQHSTPSQQPQLNPQNYDPYGRSYLTNQGTPPGITIPQPQHPLSTNTAFSQVQPQASPIQPSGSPLGSFQQRQTASPSVVPHTAPTVITASAKDIKPQNGSNRSVPPGSESKKYLPVAKTQQSSTGLISKEKQGTDTVLGEVRKAVQDTAQQTDKEQKIHKVKNEAMSPGLVAKIKPLTVAQKKESAKTSRAPVAIPGAPKQPPGYHDEKPCEWLVGDLVWSKVSGHPWWPCMVAYDPNLGIYTKMQGGIGRGFRMYHVQFFGEVPERGWVSGLRIKKFEGRNQYDELVREMIHNVKKKDRTKLAAKLAVNASRKSAWEVGVQECLKALPMSRHERKLNFTFKYDMPKSKGGMVNPEPIDIVSFGDHPKMKAKRAYKKEKDDSKDKEEQVSQVKKSADTKKDSGKTKTVSKTKSISDSKSVKEPKTPKIKIPKEAIPRSLRKRGRKSFQFLKFLTERKEQFKEENVLLSKKKLYMKMEAEWNELTSEEKAMYTEVTTPKKSDRKRKREENTPTVEPVLKRSKREAKPSRRIQESELSNLNFAKRGLKAVPLYFSFQSKDSPEPSEEKEEKKITIKEKAVVPEVPAVVPSVGQETSPTDQTAKREKLQKDTASPKPIVSKKGRKVKKPTQYSTASNNAEEVQPTKRQGRNKSRKSSISDEMSKDFEEMQEEAPLVIDTSAITSSLESPSEPSGGSEKGVSSRRTSISTTTGKESLRRSTRLKL